MVGQANEEASDWRAAWEPVAAQIGRRLDETPPVPGGVPISVEAVRRYLEPLEFDCPLHYDSHVAQAHGYADIIAPYTSATSFALSPLWTPGVPLFTDADRDAQPARSNVRPSLPADAPPISSYFAASMDVDFLRPIVVGDRLTRLSPILRACNPKETKVGRGAFLTLESSIVDCQGATVARMTVTAYFYDAHDHATT